MIKTIIKRNGEREPFRSEKLNGWGEWAAAKLGRTVDWPGAVLHVVSTMPAECTSETLQLSLIDYCLSKSTWEYNRMAGRLYSALIVKKLYNGVRPTVKELHAKMVAANIMIKLNYSDEEYEEIEKIINHKLDLDSAHFELHQSRFKYALRDKVSGKEYESQQFVYMRMAMALAETEEPSVRMMHLKNWYNHFSHKRLNPPTPVFTNLGTAHSGYASCSVYTTDDTAASLAAGDHIAYMMTVMSAGIGTHIKTRSLGDKVRGGIIQHQGKLPYYRALVGAIGANLQNGRGGASTVHYTAFDPEVEVIAKAKNPMTPAAKQVRGADYSFGSNKFFARKVARDEEIGLFSYQSAPEVYNAQYSKDLSEFERVYTIAVQEKRITKFVPARSVLINALNEAFETGRHYLHFTDTMNTHTPFKDTIFSSNLCLRGDARITIATEDFEANISIKDFVEQYNSGVLKNCSVKSCNTKTNLVTWAKVTAAAQTATVTELFTITDDTGDSITCTGDHQIFTNNRGFVKANELTCADVLCKPYDEETVGVSAEIKRVTVESTPVYDITVPETSCFFANNLLVHNCQEIFLPTKSFSSVADLYREYQDGDGEIGLCSLGGVIASNVPTDAMYADVAYYALKMIDKCIHMSTYVFKSLEHTAKARLSAGVGVVGLAHLMAKKGMKYSTVEGRNFIHELFETHMWHLINASLRLGKELGNAPWMHKTKWPEGWLPIDTYERRVNELVTVQNKRDWEWLRQQIIENKGIRNSVVCAIMPAESSANSAGTTNGVYPLRDFDLIKTNETLVLHYVAPDSTKLRDKYELAWNIDQQDLIKCYAVMQKWVDQGISADLYRRLQGADKVGTTEMITTYLNMVKYGLKSRYYQNSLTAKGIASSKTDATIAVDAAPPEQDGYCESCAI